jgi:hypothetical protein
VPEGRHLKPDLEKRRATQKAGASQTSPDFGDTLRPDFNLCFLDLETQSIPLLRGGETNSPAVRPVRRPERIKGSKKMPGSARPVPYFRGTFCPYFGLCFLDLET